MNEKPALRPEVAIGEALRAIANEVLSDAAKALDNSDYTDAVAVHEFRREMKRWRSLLRLLHPFLEDGSEALQLVARDLARDLGGARDPQSALDAFNDLIEHDLPVSPASTRTIRKRIEGLRAAGEARSLTPPMRKRIDAALTDAAAAINQWPLHVLTFSDIARQLAVGYRLARRAVPDTWSSATPEALHELRKLVVIHRYQMQVVEPLWQRFTKMWITEAQRLRERLGMHQDLEVLQALIQPGQPLAHWRLRIERPIVARKRRHVIAARQIASRLFVDKPSAFRRRLLVMWETG